MSEHSLSASRVIDAPADAIFDVLSLPSRHRQIDGSGTVVSGDDQRLHKVGQVFVMNMNGEHMGGDYVMENTVSGYDENKLLAWRPKPQGAELEGWEWIWELEPQGPGATLVTETYSWEHASPEARKAVSFPLFEEGALEHSLERLAAAVSEM
ncbi:SRPBCC family protein [Kocuria aegyptia]|uniref:SRPBCC family protein n=1 Tax=Kocuria aegyptia TaxID=330943 RepID=A0ABN2KD26_9MICC